MLGGGEIDAAILWPRYAPSRVNPRLTRGAWRVSPTSVCVLTWEGLPQLAPDINARVNRAAPLFTPRLCSCSHQVAAPARAWVPMRCTLDHTRFHTTVRPCLHLCVCYLRFSLHHVAPTFTPHCFLVSSLVVERVCRLCVCVCVLCVGVSSVCVRVYMCSYVFVCCRRFVCMCA